MSEFIKTEVVFLRMHCEPFETTDLKRQIRTINRKMRRVKKLIKMEKLHLLYQYTEEL